MNSTPLTEAEEILRDLSTQLTQPTESECLLCYVFRMLDHGCQGLRWAQRYRDLRAPRATALEQRLRQHGARCDCGIIVHGYELRFEHLVVELVITERGIVSVGDPEYPDPMPACRGARAGSTKPCALWQRQPRSRW